MSTSKAKRAAAPRKIAPATAIHLEQLRQRLFRAMSFVHTTRQALDHDLYCERDTLFAAFKIVDEVAGELNNISGHNGPLPSHEDEGGVSS